ncbi:sensor histidine kinase [Parvularcula maris]|uniref:histidine kinase n=1 Tax=Parvularcula maris TaxID=2965077 RepID=A0A9X2L7F1_9PROT|nr:CHASE3 domain-containing protein [Parvularcula maris]MCQ8184422.1 CHASE3 domain-containing protein [Parvularcula maris]
MDRVQSFLGRTPSWFVLTGFAVLLLTLGSLLAATVSDIRFQGTELDRAKRHSAELIALRSALLDAETGQRGYLLTGKTEYLEPFTEGTSRLEQRLDAALSSSHYTAIFPDIQGDLIRSLSEAKIAELWETIRLYDEGDREGALALVRTDRGRSDMERLRLLIGGELNREVSREALAAARIESSNTRLVVFFSVLALVLGFLIAYLFRATSQAKHAVETLSSAQDDATEARAGLEHYELLANELDHRIKNIFAVGSSMIRQTAAGGSPAIKEFSAELDSRFLSLGKAYGMTTGINTNRSMGADELVEKIVGSQILPEHQFEHRGGNFDLDRKAVVPMALILHELTTNALKYGAWKLAQDRVGQATLATGSDAGEQNVVRFPDTGSERNELPASDEPAASGEVLLRWEVGPDERCTITWNERGLRRGKGEPTREGYGSRLMKACAMQLGGRMERDWQSDGLKVVIEADPGKLLAS